MSINACMHDHARAANSAGRGKKFRMGSHSEVVYHRNNDWGKILYLICIKLELTFSASCNVVCYGCHNTGHC